MIHFALIRFTYPVLSYVKVLTLTRVHVAYTLFITSFVPARYFAQRRSSWPSTPGPVAAKLPPSSFRTGSIFRLIMLIVVFLRDFNLWLLFLKVICCFFSRLNDLIRLIVVFLRDFNLSLLFLKVICCFFSRLNFYICLCCFCFCKLMLVLFVFL